MSVFFLSFGVDILWNHYGDLKRCDVVIFGPSFGPFCRPTFALLLAPFAPGNLPGSDREYLP